MKAIRSGAFTPTDYALVLENTKEASRRAAEGAEKNFFVIEINLPPANIWVAKRHDYGAQRNQRNIIDAAYKIHVALGPGLLETVYEVALAHELRKRGLRVERQVPIPIVYDGLRFDEGFKADLLVEEKVIVELKSADKNHPIHSKQLKTQLVLTKLQLGLVLNFGLEYMKDGISRVVNGLPESKASD